MPVPARPRNEVRGSFFSRPNYWRLSLRRMTITRAIIPTISCPMPTRSCAIAMCDGSSCPSHTVQKVRKVPNACDPKLPSGGCPASPKCRGGVRVKSALPTASGGGMTRHPRMGAAERCQVTAGELGETKAVARFAAP